MSKNNSIRQYVDTLVRNTCKCLTSLPTRIAAASQILIDYIYSSDPKNVVLSGILRCDITDHLPIFTVMANVKRKHQSREEYFKGNMKNFNSDVFLEQLDDILKTLNMQSHKTVNDKFDEFAEIFTEVVNRHGTLLTAFQKESKTLDDLRSHKLYLTQKLHV